MKNRQDVDRKFFLLFILWNTGNVLRTGTGGVARFFYAFTAFALGKYLTLSGGPLEQVPPRRYICSSGSWSPSVLSVGFTWITSNLGAAYPCQHSTLSKPRRLSAARWDASLDLSCCSELPYPHPAIGTHALCTHSCLLHCRNSLF